MSLVSKSGSKIYPISTYFLIPTEKVDNIYRQWTIHKPIHSLLEIFFIILQK